MIDNSALIKARSDFSPRPSSRSSSIKKTIIELALESYEILRHDALRHASQLKEFNRKAYLAYRHGMSYVASFYNHRANEEAKLMKDANQAACERLSQWKITQFYRTQRLDLHGLLSNEALNLFKQIEQEFNEENRRTYPKPIEIVTGRGKNFVYGSVHDKIYSNILTYLQQRNYK